MQSLFRMSLEGSLRDGEVWVAGFDNHIEAAALWTEPGKDAIISFVLHAFSLSWRAVLTAL